jgi:hypothetical protein
VHDRRRLTLLACLLAVCLVAIAAPVAGAGGGSVASSSRTQEPPTPDRDWRSGAATRALDEWLLFLHLMAAGVDGPSSSRQSLSLDGAFDLQPGAAPSVEGLDSSELSLGTSVVDKEPSDLRFLVGEGDRRHLMQIGTVAASRRSGARLTAYGQVAYTPRDPLEPWETESGAHQLVAAGVRGEVDQLEIGAEYRSFGKRLERLLAGVQNRKDQEGGEVWVARRFGPIRLRLSQSELSDNVDENPARPRTTRAQSALTTELGVPAWPTLALTYATGRSERVAVGAAARGQPPDRQDFDGLTASSYLSGAGWEVTLSSTYTRSRDRAIGDHETTALCHDLSASLHLSQAVTLTPAVSLGQDRYGWSSERSDTQTMSVTLSYQPPYQRWHAWALASYTRSRSSDASVDASSTSAVAAIAWELGRLPIGRASVAVEGGYDRYLDAVSPVSSSNGAFVLFRFKIASF